jgi:hypothetical protein
MNHVLKMAVDWKPKATPELVDKIYDAVNLQFLDMKRALYGNGNYRIAPKFSAYVIPKLTWQQKSNEQKSSHFQNVVHRFRVVVGPQFPLSFSALLGSVTYLPTRSLKHTEK